MAIEKGLQGVSYEKVGEEYFEKRGLRRHARAWSLWALGVGAVISGDFFGWNYGLATGGFGGLFVATVLVSIMYIGLCYCLAEMSPALPHTGGAYSFARTTMGPWGGFITGLGENMEYVITPGVIIISVGAYLQTIFNTPPELQWVWWVIVFVIFVGLNVWGVELSFKFTVVITFIAMAILIFFFLAALSVFDFHKYALNMGVGPDGGAVELPEGGGPFLPFGWDGVLKSLPFAIWFLLAIEQLPLAAEESHDPKRDMPKGLLWGILTLVILGFLTLLFNSSIPPGAFEARQLSAAVVGWFDRHLRRRARHEDPGLACGSRTDRQFPHDHLRLWTQHLLAEPGRLLSALDVDHPRRAENTACSSDFGRRCGSRPGPVHELRVRPASYVGAALLNMAVFGAVISYTMQGLSYYTCGVIFRTLIGRIAAPWATSGRSPAWRLQF